MKKRDGFTLIELIVGMAIMAIIFGGIVYIFGASTKAMQAGQNQQQAYEDARVTMDILKTSLRYAILDDTSHAMEPAQPDKTTTSFTFYTNQFDLHWDVTNGETKTYKVVADFKTGTNPNSTTAWASGKKQLVITITDVDTGKQVSKSPFKYPQYEVNSGWASDADFPIIYGEENSTEGAFKTGITLYNIHLPFVYKIAGSDKTETLDSRVQPVAETHFDIQRSGGTSTQPTTTTSTTTAQTMLDQYNLLVSARDKKWSNQTMTTAEAAAYKAYSKYIYGSENYVWYNAYNTYIRAYLLDTFYNGTWPTFTVTYTNSAGEKATTTMYMQPANSEMPETGYTFIVLNDFCNNEKEYTKYVYSYAQAVYNPNSDLRKVDWYRYGYNSKSGNYIAYYRVGKISDQLIYDIQDTSLFVDNTVDTNFAVN